MDENIKQIIEFNAIDLFEENDFIETFECNNKFDLISSSEFLLESLKLPKKDFSLRTISPTKGFSSCSLIMAINELEKIENLHATTLRVGKKEVQAIEDLNINNVNICVCGISKHNGKYDYDDVLKQVAQKNKWNLTYINNHSKIILLKTIKNYYVIETSSNLNENPKIEQFCITNSQELYGWYLNEMVKLGVWQ